MTMTAAFRAMLDDLQAGDVSPLQLDGVLAWRDLCTGYAAKVAEFHGWSTKVPAGRSETHAAWVHAAGLIITDLSDQASEASVRHGTAARAAGEASATAARAMAAADHHARAAVAVSASDPAGAAMHRDQARQLVGIADLARQEEREHTRVASAAMLWQSLANDGFIAGRRLVRDITGLYAEVAAALASAGGAREVYDSKLTNSRAGAVA